MILVIGGMASGRRSYVRSLGFAEADMSSDAYDDAPVLVDAQELVRPDDSDASSLAAAIARRKKVVICQEVGSGVVPLERGEREWRERAGALAKELAARADAVVRMTCGIAQALKGDLPCNEAEAACHGSAEVDGRHVCAGSTDETSGEGGPAPVDCGDELADQVRHPQPGSSFFTNRLCEYFPCHEGVDEQDFNCLFCYCPLYALGPDCGGNFTYTESGRKNCKDCVIPHVRDAGARLVAGKYGQLAALAAEGARS